MAHSLTKVAPYSCINVRDISKKSVLEMSLGLMIYLRWARRDGLTLLALLCLESRVIDCRSGAFSEPDSYCVFIEVCF